MPCGAAVFGPIFRVEICSPAENVLRPVRICVLHQPRDRIPECGSRGRGRVLVLPNLRHSSFALCRLQRSCWAAILSATTHRLALGAPRPGRPCAETREKVARYRCSEPRVKCAASPMLELREHNLLYTNLANLYSRSCISAGRKHSSKVQSRSRQAGGGHLTAAWSGCPWFKLVAGAGTQREVVHLGLLINSGQTDQVPRSRVRNLAGGPVHLLCPLSPGQNWPHQRYLPLLCLPHQTHESITDMIGGDGKYST